MSTPLTTPVMFIQPSEANANLFARTVLPLGLTLARTNIPLFTHPRTRDLLALPPSLPRIEGATDATQEIERIDPSSIAEGGSKPKSEREVDGCQRWIRQSRETTGKVGVSRFPGVSRDFPAVQTLTVGCERRRHRVCRFNRRRRSKRRPQY